MVSIKFLATLMHLVMYVFTCKHTHTHARARNIYPVTGPGYTESMSTHSAAVPIAMASGELSVRVRIKQVDSEPGPKLEVDGFLGSLHLLLSPQQLSMLLELAHGMGHQGG